MNDIKNGGIEASTTGDYMKKVLDLGDLHLVLGSKGSKFKLEGKVLTVPYGCTLDEIDAFLKTVRGQP